MDNNKNIHEGHRARMRKRFRETGFDGFNDHEILEMILYYICPRKNTNDIAHQLIDKFGSFAGVLDAEYDDLINMKNISENAAILFKIITKTLPAYYNSRSDGIQFDSIEKIMRMFERYFVGLNHEEMRMACFDNNFRMLSNILVSSGTQYSANISVRTNIKEVLRTNASSAVICHNHPHCDTTASAEDKNATKQISHILKMINVELIDHIIVTEERTYSLRQYGYMTLF